MAPTMLSGAISTTRGALLVAHLSQLKKVCSALSSILGQSADKALTVLKIGLEISTTGQNLRQVRTDHPMLPAAAAARRVVAVWAF